MTPLVAVIFSRTTSQVLIAFLTAVTAVGGPFATWLFHRAITQVKVTVNGRMSRLEQELEEARAALMEHGVPPPPPPPITVPAQASKV